MERESYKLNFCDGPRLMIVPLGQITGHTFYIENPFGLKYH